MSCPEHEVLSAFADGELDASATPQIERHLSGCALCRELVDELRWVDASGRSALRSIRVPSRPLAVRERPTSLWFLQPLPLAAAAVILIGLSVTVWDLFFRPDEGRLMSAPSAATRISSNTDRATPAKAAEPVMAGKFRAPSDEAFERWAEPYRRLRIPLLPLEDIANYQPQETPPARPVPATRDGAG